MARDLDEFRLGTWVLTLDLLGTAVQMALDNWVHELNQLLGTISVSVHEALTFSTYDLHVIQYGDSVTFCHDNLQQLICLGTNVQVGLFRQDILAQLGLSGGGIYYLDDTNIHHIVEGLPNFKLHCVAGWGFARSHLLLRGIKGPRFIIDEEIRRVPPVGPSWEKLTLDPNPNGPVRCSELRWWKDLPDIVQMTKDRIKKLGSAIESENAAIKKEVPHPDARALRGVHSLTKRLEHYQCFLQVLEREPGR